MKNHILYVLVFLLFTVCSYTVIPSKRCHIYFDISTKCQMTEESDDGNYRKYFDEKNSFGLEVNKIKSKKPNVTIKDSLFSWGNTCNSGSKELNADSVLVNNIDLMTFTFKCEKKKLTTQFYTFPTKNQVYQLKFTFPSSKSEKARKEINKIIQSLSLDCD